jgi:glycerol-1-phosphate dehydrogenase [NAD(P)+]
MLPKLVEDESAGFGSFLLEAKVLETNLPDHVFYYCGDSAIDQLLAFCQVKHYHRFLLICDRNTHSVLGERVATALIARGWEVLKVVLEGEEVIADEEYLAQVFFRADGEARLYLAVGSGTITDIVRFCSHRSGNSFAAIPTAPSVDGFASLIAPVVIRRFKDTAYCQPPVGIFADIQTLCQAPPRMIAAGFGDMLGKYTALADWKLGSLIWGEPYHPEIAQRMRNALNSCVQKAGEIGRAEPAGIAGLMHGLVESGVCMLLNGNSRPASGAEHHLSHYWEMMLLRQGRPAILHGAKVGVGTAHIARQYEAIRRLPQMEVKRRLEQASPPDRERELAEIRAVFGPAASQIEILQGRFWSMTASQFALLKEQVYGHWDEIQLLAADVPPAEGITELLDKVAAPSDAHMLGLSSEEESEALRFAHYLRSQFTVTRLGRLLALW